MYLMQYLHYAPNYMLQVDCFGGGSVMVWTGILHGDRAALVHMAGALTGIRKEGNVLL